MATGLNNDHSDSTVSRYFRKIFFSISRLVFHSVFPRWKSIGHIFSVMVEVNFFCSYSHQHCMRNFYTNFSFWPKIRNPNSKHIKGAQNILVQKSCIKNVVEIDNWRQKKILPCRRKVSKKVFQLSSLFYFSVKVSFPMLFLLL